MLKTVPAGKRGILKKLPLARGGNSQRVQPTLQHAEELLGDSAVVRNHIPRLRRVGSKMIQLGTFELFFRGIEKAPFVRQYGEAAHATAVGVASGNGKWLPVG